MLVCKTSLEHQGQGAKMAESSLGSLLGEEEDRSAAEALDAEGTGASGSAEAFAAAVAAIASRQDPEVARDTSLFLKKHARLRDIQAEHLIEEHKLRIQHLRNQLKEESVRRLGMRLKVAFQIFVAVVATTLGVAAGIMLHDAFTARDIVIEPFDAAAPVQDHGLSGKTIASSLLDELRHLQNTTHANVEHRTLSQSWSEEIKLEIPEVGISIGDLARALRARFGHDWHIAGDVIALDAGQVALTVRGSELESKTFAGPAADLPKLITTAAEYVYSQAEPVLWAYYLTYRGRDQEAVDFCKAAFAGAEKSIRPYLLNTWANAASNLGDNAEALDLYREAIRLKPDYWTAYYNLQLTLATSGEEESAWRAGQEMKRAARGRPGRATEADFQILDWLTYDFPALLDSYYADAERNGGVGTASRDVGTNIAMVQVFMHDLRGAAITLQTIKPDPSNRATTAVTSLVRVYLEVQQGNIPLALSYMERFRADVNPAVLSELIGSYCPLALLEQAAGRADKADEVLRSAGKSLDCLRFRGDILEARGHWDEAQKAYAEAVAFAPDLPAGYYSWGVALLKHKDFAGALEKLNAAHKRGPHWADPLKAMGDVFAAQKRRTDALSAYDQALKFAPAWGELRRLREQAQLDH